MARRSSEQRRRTGAIAWLALAAALAACASALASSDIQLTIGGTEIRVLDSGAIIVDKRQVGTIGKNGKILSSRGQLLAWVHEDNIRLRGGTAVPIKTDKDGAMYLPESPQRKAQLAPIKYRVHKDGRISLTKGARGIDIRGAKSEKHRRIVLALLLLTANEMWAPATGASPQ